MILTDAGPLIALINRNDPHHDPCVELARRLPPQPLLTTWPCFTEAMYLLQKAGGHPAQARLWALRDPDHLLLHDLNDAEMDRAAELMSQYPDLPMDLADASLVAVAESRGLHRIFTLDGDFHIYRLRDGSALEIVP